MYDDTVTSHYRQNQTTLRSAMTVAALTLLTVTGCIANPGEASSSTSPEAPRYGDLVVHVEDGPWQGGQYEPAAQFMSGNIALKIGRYSNELEALTVITEDGQTDTVNYDP